MSKKKTWFELAPITQERRMVKFAQDVLPRTDRNPFATMAALHANCANGAGCVGPGCRRQR